MKTCKACSYCYLDDWDFICGHPDAKAGVFGDYTYKAIMDNGHCGPDRPKFEQHPLRNEDGTLKP